MITCRSYRLRPVPFLKPKRGGPSAQAALRKRAVVTRRVNDHIERVNRRVAIAWRIACMAGVEPQQS